uniref:hypothetical protein n=1 Tax=Alistipes sp. TaxID=1872444 RepID=UPI00405731D9
MSTTKVYRLKRAFRLAVPIVLEGGEKRYIRFVGGSRPSRTLGYFSTKNPSLQKALEQSPLYNQEFYLERDIKAVAKNNEEEKSPSIEECLRNPETAIRDTSVNSKKMAIAFVLAEFGKSFPDDVSTVEEYKRYAAEHFNVLFEKW